MTHAESTLPYAQTQYRDLELRATQYRLQPGGPAEMPDDGIIDPVSIVRMLTGGNPRPRITPRELVIIVYEGLRRGKNDTEIADLLDCSVTTARDIRLRNGLPSSFRYSEDYLAQLILEPPRRREARPEALRAAGIAV